MSRGYYSPADLPFHYAATGDSSSGGGSGSGMECLQLRSSPAPFHYHIGDQAKSLVALQELQNEVGALLEFRDLVIEAFPNLRSKLASGGTSGGSSVSGARRDWEPGVRVRRKLPARDSDSLPRSRSDSHSKPTAKGDGAHSVVQDSGFSTETSSSKEAHSSQAGPPPRTPAYEQELWQLLDVIQIRGGRLRDDADALRVALADRRSHSLTALCTPESDPSDEFRRVLAAASAEDIDALRRERDLLLDRLAELEAETLAGRVEAERRNTIESNDEYDERPCRPSAPAPLRGRSVSAHDSVFTPVTSGIPTTPDDDSDSETEHDYSGAYRTQLGKLDKVMNTPVRNLKIKTPDSKKFSAILRESNPIELQRHLLMFTVYNQILQNKLEKLGRSKGNLVERLHRTREENDDLKFQLEEKTIELEGSRAQVRLLESGGRRLSSNVAPRSMRALQALPLHLQLDEDVETEAEIEPEPETSRIVETPRRRPSKIPLPPSKRSLSGLAPKPPTGRSKDNPSYRSRSGDSLGRPGSAQSWRHKSDINSLSGSKSGNSICSTKSPSGGKNSSFITLRSNKESISKNRDFKHSKDSLTGKVRNNDSLSRMRDSNLSSSNSILCNSRKDSSGSMTPKNSKKSSVPIRRASSGSSVRTGESSTKPNGVLVNSWMRTSFDGRPRSHADSLHSESSEEDIVQPSSEERQLLHDFINRSDRLAKDRTIHYLTLNFSHSNFENFDEYLDKKRELEFAYKSPISIKIKSSSSYIEPRYHTGSDLLTMDVSTIYNTPTKSDVLFFNQSLHDSQRSVWNKQPPQFFDSLAHLVNLDSNYCSTLQSVTNDSVKREGLAECDSLEKKISFE